MTEQSSKTNIKEKPRICAIDLDQEIVEALRARGLHCFAGTLGSQVKVPNLARRDTHPCLLNYRFPPNLHEYDIVLVDLQAQEPVEYDKSKHILSSFKGSQQIKFLSSYPETIFDPRSASSSILRELLKDLFRKETLIIVFPDANARIDYYPVLVTRHDIQEQNPINSSLYEFIPCIPENRNKMGQNVLVSNIREDLNIFLQKYSRYFIYKIVFNHPEKWLHDEQKSVKRDNFIPLLLNNDDEVIGFIDYELLPSKVLVFPQLTDRKKDFVLELIDEILPGLFPKNFPYSEQFSWLKSKDYFLPNQANILANKEKLENEYKKSLVKIEEEIQQNQIKYRFLHDLITETGDALVKSVEELFRWLGFANIINMDETNPKVKEEDIQIPLDNGLLVIEVKGLGGTSKDSECSQISKIKYRRGRERNSYDVFALYLVNHQRYLPPDKRKNPPFTEVQIADAQSDERGLLTTYELFNLYSNIEEGFVTKKDAKSALLKYGLVQFKPSNARLIGYPLEVYRKGEIVILNINNFLIHKGATLIVCNGGAWFKAEVLEIRVNDKVVESASEGEIGIRLSRSVLKTSELWLQNINIKQ